MKTIEINGNIVCYDSYKLEEKIELQELLKRENLEEFLRKIQKKIVLVFGGDGTILQAIKENYKKNLPFLGINFGGKGFLLNNKNHINNKKFTYREYPLFEVKENNELKGVVFNDINIYSPNGKLLELEVCGENTGKIILRGDGVIISTPAGSTGHNKSYSGPLLPHDSKNLIITPKGNIKQESSKIISNQEVIYIKNTGRKFELAINSDGEKIITSKFNEDISIDFSKSKNKIKFLIAGDYLKTWDSKVMYEQGFKR